MSRKVLIPAAGNGSRLFPLTICIPKEILPILDRPMIDFSIEECMKSNIRNIGVVIREEKKIIKKYLERKYSSLSFCYIFQEQPQGLGHAVLISENLVSDTEFGILLPDDIIISKNPCIKNLFDLYDKYNASIIAIENVENVEKYGIIKGEEIDNRIYRIQDAIEKPKHGEIDSKLGIVGRYIFTPEIFSALHMISKKQKIIELTDAIRILLKKEDVYAYKIDGKRYDCGELDGYKKTVIHFALRHQQRGGNKW